MKRPDRRDELGKRIIFVWGPLLCSEQFLEALLGDAVFESGVGWDAYCGSSLALFILLSFLISLVDSLSDLRAYMLSRQDGCRLVGGVTFILVVGNSCFLMTARLWNQHFERKKQQVVPSNRNAFDSDSSFSTGPVMGDKICFRKDSGCEMQDVVILASWRYF